MKTNEIPKPKDGWIYYGLGPLKVPPNEGMREDVAMYAHNHISKQWAWDYTPWIGQCDDRHYALRAGSEIARLNGLIEPERKSQDVKQMGAVTIARNGYIEELESQLADAREEARTWETRYDEMIKTCVLTAKERDEARAQRDRLFDRLRNLLNCVKQARVGDSHMVHKFFIVAIDAEIEASESTLYDIKNPPANH